MPTHIKEMNVKEHLKEGIRTEEQAQLAERRPGMREASPAEPCKGSW